MHSVGGPYLTLDLVIITNLLRHLKFKLNVIACEFIYDLLEAVRGLQIPLVLHLKSPTRLPIGL